MAVWVAGRPSAGGVRGQAVARSVAQATRTAATAKPAHVARQPPGATVTSIAATTTPMPVPLLTTACARSACSRLTVAATAATSAGEAVPVAAYLQRRHERWRQTWDDVLAHTTDPQDRLLSVFDALALFRLQTGSTGGCAFLAAAAELPDTAASGSAHAASRWVAADTTLLRHRLGELASATGVHDPDGLAAELIVIYDGALAGYARHSHDPLAPARRLAQAALSRHRAAVP